MNALKIYFTFNFCEYAKAFIKNQSRNFKFNPVERILPVKFYLDLYFKKKYELLT